jgi:hypothetical protein
MNIKITALRFLQVITFLTILILAGLFHIAWGEFVFTFLILGVAITFLVVQINVFSNLDSEKNWVIVRGIVLSWIFILYLLFFYFIETPHRKIWIYLIWIPFFLLFLCIIITGEWREILRSLSRFFKSIKLVLEYYLSKRYKKTN